MQNALNNIESFHCLDNKDFKYIQFFPNLQKIYISSKKLKCEVESLEHC